MNEWLSDELVELERRKLDAQSRHERLNLIQQHTGRVFEQMKELILDAANRMNGIERFRNTVGGLQCQSGYVDRVQVVKETYPAIYLTVKRGPNTIDIERKIVTNGANRRTRDQSESLEVDLDEQGHPFLRNKEGESLLIEEAVRYLFRPFLYPELLDTPGQKSKRDLKIV